ncbi:MAG: hypothetical protein HY908_03270 [Myxococcales bacterium]|nr:hypothetical protein [Myxococcales bacterium]
MRILVLAAIAAGLTTGCGDACVDDLEPVCDLCLDANHKASCYESVHRDNQAMCARDVDAFKAICK